MIEKKLTTFSFSPSLPRPPPLFSVYRIISLSIFPTPWKVKEKGEKTQQVFLHLFFSLSLYPSQYHALSFQPLTKKRTKGEKEAQQKFTFSLFHHALSLSTLSREESVWEESKKKKKKERNRYFFSIPILLIFSLSLSLPPSFTISREKGNERERREREGSPNLACYDKSKRGHKGVRSGWRRVSVRERGRCEMVSSDLTRFCTFVN